LLRHRHHRDCRGRAWHPRADTELTVTSAGADHCSDTGADTDTGADAGANIRADAETDAGTDAETYSRTNSCADTLANFETHSSADACSDASADASADTSADAARWLAVHQLQHLRAMRRSGVDQALLPILRREVPGKRRSLFVGDQHHGGWCMSDAGANAHTDAKPNSVTDASSVSKRLFLIVVVILNDINLVRFIVARFILILFANIFSYIFLIVIVLVGRVGVN
jgi:hypothetical protein